MHAPLNVVPLMQVHVLTPEDRSCLADATRKCGAALACSCAYDSKGDLDALVAVPGLPGQEFEPP